MKTFASALLVAGIIGCSGCTQQRAPELEPSKTNSVSTAPRTEKPWEPVAFNKSDRKFHANKSNAFFSELIKSIEKGGKTEFETTEEHQNRIKSNELLHPFKSTSAYAIDVQYDSVNYDADKQEYSSHSGLWCQHGYPIEEGISCSISEAIDEHDRYTGQNAFGATAEVSRERGRKFYLVVNSDSKRHLYKSKVSGSTLIDSSCHVPIEIAKNINTKSVAVGLVIRIREPKVLSGHTQYQDATVQDPRDSIFISTGIPATIVHTVCYNKETLDILSIK